MGELLSAAFRIPMQHRTAAAVFLLVASLPWAAFTVVRELFLPPVDYESIVRTPGGAAFELDRWIEVVRPLAFYLAVAAAAGIVNWIFWLWATGMFTTVIVDGMAGRSRPLRSAFRTSLGRLPSLVGANVLAIVGVSLGIVLCVAPGLVFTVYCSMVDPAAVVGRKGPFASIGKSCALTYRAFWPVVVLVLVWFVAGLGVTWILLIPAGLLRGVPVANGVISVAQDLAGHAVSLLPIAGAAYAYVRLGGDGVPRV